MCGGVYFVRVLVGGRGLVRGRGCSFAINTLFLRLGAILWAMLGLVGKIDLRDWFCSTGFQDNLFDLLD